MTPVMLQESFDTLEAFAAETWSNLQAVARLREIHHQVHDVCGSDAALSMHFARAILMASKTRSNARLVLIVQELRSKVNELIKQRCLG